MKKIWVDKLEYIDFYIEELDSDLIYSGPIIELDDDDREKLIAKDATITFKHLYIKYILSITNEKIVLLKKSNNYIYAYHRHSQHTVYKILKELVSSQNIEESK